MSDNQCPRCKKTLTMRGDSELCPDGCGEWFDRSAMPPVKADDTWGKAGLCPRCQNQMPYLTVRNFTVQCCLDHGVFVSAPDRRAFIEMFHDHAVKAQEATEEAKKLQAAEEELIDRVVKELADPRELARRIIMLERYVATLFQRI